MRIRLGIAVAVAALPYAATALAHGGGLDGLGCHNDREKGTYHCHQGSLRGKAYESKADATRDLGRVDRTRSEDERGKERPAATKDTNAVDRPAGTK